MAEIDRLEINVTANVDDAIARLNRLASTLRGVNGALQSAAQGQKVLESNTQHADEATEREAVSIGKLSERLKSITKPLASFASQVGHGLVGALKGAGHAVLGFMRQIVRIARVRAIRAMLKDLGQSFKDLYGWSNLFGTDYAKSMDKITTATTYLRNSIAAMAAPLVNAIAPVLDFLIDKVVTVLNWFNQLFAVLNGQDTYTVAIKKAKTYGETLEGSTEKAKKSVEDLKRTILGFDEINKLNGNNDNGSGSSTGKSPYSDGYETMFKELPVGSGFKDFGDRLEKALSNTISRIALILAGASFVIGAILAFSGINIPAGIAMMVAGITIGAVTLYWDKLAEMLRGPIGKATAIVAGASLVLGIFALLLGQVPIGLGLILLGLTGLAATAAANWDKLVEFGKKAIKKVKKGWDSLKEKAFEIAAKIKTKASELWEKIKEKWAKIKEKTVEFFVKIGTSVSGLWEKIKEKWAEIKGKTVEFFVRVGTSVLGLWEKIKAKWAEIKEKTVEFFVKIGTNVSNLWGRLKAKWLEIKDKTVEFFVEIGTKVSNLWGRLKAKWLEIKDKTVEFFVKIGTSISGLWERLKAKWAEIKDKTVEFFAKVGTKAESLWGKLKADWIKVKDKTVEFYSKIKNTAQSLWDKLKNAWDLLKKDPVEFFAKIGTSVENLWGKLKADWLNIKEKTVEFFAKIKTTAESLWGRLKAGWLQLKDKTVEFFAKIKTTAESLWGRLKAEWLKVKDKTIELFAKFRTKASDLWGKIKAEWLKLKEKTVELFAKIKTKAENLWGKLKTDWLKVKEKTVEFFAKIGNTVQSLWDKLKNAWDLLKKDPVEFFAKIGTTVYSLWEWLKDAWDTYVKDKALEVELKIKTVVQTVYNAVQGAFHDIGVAIGGLFGSSAQAEEGAYQSEALMALEVTDSGSFDSTYQSKIDKMVEAVNNGWKEAKRITSEAWTDILTTALTGVDNIGKGLDIDLKPKIIDKLAECWQAIWDDTAIKWTGIQGTVMQSFTNLTTGFELKLPTFETMMHDCWSNIESDTKTIWGNIEKAVKDYIRNIKSAMQMPHFYVNWATADMGWLGSFSYPRSLGVNWYARGGILDGAQIFGRMGDMLLGGGEAGREAVLPLEQNTGWMDTLADRIYDNNVQRAQTDGTNQSGAELAVMNAMLTEMRSMLNELRGINEKEFSTQITTSDINRAQTRANRRAGVTVAPVGGA